MVSLPPQELLGLGPRVVSTIAILQQLSDIYKPDIYSIMPRSTKARKDAAKADEPKVLVGVRVSKRFRDRIDAECVRRDLSLQELIIAALKLYFATPRQWDYADVTFVVDDDNVSEQQAAERNSWGGLWERYLDRMPREKIELMVSAMKWDLLAKKSSRRKLGRLGR
jgi:hypothetical protein